MRKLYNLLACLIALSASTGTMSQTARTWNQKSCAVVLTYDDAINADLDNILPALDSLNLKATFYLIGSSPVVVNRMEEWRKAARNGHELGNHSLFHPCDGSLPGRNWITADNDLSKYTVNRAVAEIRQTNTLLQAIDGKTRRTFAYPCGDQTIRDTFFYAGLRKDFVAARGVRGALDSINTVNLDNVDCYAMNGNTAEQMIALVNQAMKTHTLLVFLFHGVGGGHAINVGLQEHSQLLHYLKDHEKDIWIAPMVEVASYIRSRSAIQTMDSNMAAAAPATLK
jgi:peptidoglycan/xylan/chitin deacetylase (PgdA/CDA1 family)